MRGYMMTPAEDGVGDLKVWERRAVDAVGTAIEFWGFKHNHGRVWALLYLRARPLSSQEIQDALQLSKGAASMILRELEQWSVLHRVRVTGSRAWHYVAEDDAMEMIRRVLQLREGQLVGRVRTDLEAAAASAAADPAASDAERDRLGRITALAELMGVALELFTASAHLDVRAALDALRDEDEPDGRAQNSGPAS